MELYPPKTLHKSPYLQPAPHPTTSTLSTLPQHPNLDPQPAPSFSWPCQYNECTPILKPSMPPGRDGCAHHGRSLQSLCEYSAASPDPVSGVPGAARRGAPCKQQLLKPNSRDGGKPHP
ncbi:hypothetical protein VZT92_012807 [Zoarces viviparus]|uniref:Uncharacterized protein n=1 Tax=Zoarces viviparus TaxID=48416 RepID=A0AAW1F2A1_ZOAVI